MTFYQVVRPLAEDGHELVINLFIFKYGRKTAVQFIFFTKNFFFEQEKYITVTVI